MNRWDIYDELIAAVPDDLIVEKCTVGLSWIMVRSLGTGMAMTMKGDDPSPVRGSGSLVGMKVKELASYVKSWNFLEAGVGLAAINSVLNTRERAESILGPDWNKQVQDDVFHIYLEEIKDKKVTVIGHFPHLEELEPWCKLSILERMPERGDFPDPACEYILPEQDFIFCTGTTLINKTFPRLLELGSKAKFILVGPSTPFYPPLFERGVAALAGTVVDEGQGAWDYIRQGGIGPGVFKRGCRMVILRKETIDRE